MYPIEAGLISLRVVSGQNMLPYRGSCLPARAMLAERAVKFRDALAHVSSPFDSRKAVQNLTAARNNCVW